MCVTEEVQVDPCSRPRPICTRIANSCDHLPAVAGFLGGFTDPVISNHIFTHLPRSLHVLLGVHVMHLVRMTPADRRVVLHH